ncbi:conserved hypothetical protein [Methanocaldococcus vulcanius M7]|uniref:Uncharacterized protein n=1 Tax=Methanocaldococcus vulcanius (strain ATCC 700851 / DSM 12094 / M7) TaxID=579137 RepID=C9RGQ6_METVM|nr:hypothetical protein [Methanocaldococcus vulcanius]ACX72758.1 conserved hypothetical protein [Methanocaldococcus vulcanius M7]
MEDKRYIAIIGIVLVSLSIFIYVVHYLIFGKVEYILSYFLLHLAFVPIEVLLVSLIIEEILEHREKIKMLEKLNMVVGSFFNSVGEDLLRMILKGDEGNIKEYLNISQDWDKKDFEKAKELLKEYDYDINIEKVDLKALKDFLEEKREFLLRLMENPLLLEHEKFTEVLMAVFHLADELHRRKNLDNLPKSDLEHLKNDIIRAYKLLVVQWLDYLTHLKEKYPYLYSLCLRSNPFREENSIVIESN